MAQFTRKTMPEALRDIINVCPLGKYGAASVDILKKKLVEKSYSKAFAAETIEYALHDGLLVAVPAASATGQKLRNNEVKFVQLPALEEDDNADAHDFYCYECHLPGTLEHCRQCVRSFHKLCYRKKADRPNYAPPSDKMQKNQLPIFSSDNDSSDSCAEEEEDTHSITNDSEHIDQLLYDTTIDSTSLEMQLNTSSTFGSSPEAQIVQIVPKAQKVPLTSKLSLPTQIIVRGTKRSIDDGKPTIAELEDDIKAADVFYVGEVRPPMRTRPAKNCKSEMSMQAQDDEDEQNAAKETGLCTRCRLLKNAALRNPPNLGKTELCHLIDCTFETNRSWLEYDVDMDMEKMGWSTELKNLVKRLLFKNTILSVEAIAEKIRKEEYNFLMEFLVEVMDLQHNIGVFFGVYSTELESTKWLLRDLLHDLAEIRRCPDCFRYSNEKTQSSVWFAKPCVQRHELVYAKHSRFPYWPAKVIRVLNKTNKYDVRFFGGDHSRALIDARLIKPIDTEIHTLKLGRSTAIRQALEELRCYQFLSTYPPSTFSFYANPAETNLIINEVVDKYMSGDLQRMYKRKSPKNLSTRTEEVETPNSIIATTSPIAPTILVPEIITSNRRSRKRKCTLGLQPSEVLFTVEPESPSPTRMTRSKHQQESSQKLTWQQYSEIVKDFKNLEQELANIKRSDARHKALIQKYKHDLARKHLEEKAIKRKHWCYWCLKEAKYLCCIRASYCSRQCQDRNWNNGHMLVCENEMRGREPSSTT